MKHTIKTGLSFGLTSGIITTLGLMTGLNASTHSKEVVVGGILTIAVADAMSDALGIHISEESEIKHTRREIWESTLSTFLFKFLFAMTFVVPVLLFSLSTAIIVSIIWGALLLSIFSYVLAREEKIKAWEVVSEHLFIAAAVIILTTLIGSWVSSVFGQNL
ncbi:hypothetical protein HY638_02585 [Candidatus Woesearchaeota archaeon]|nr:hypothetical protein [Candidatus Woesearchaeota archaeon]